MSKYSNITSTFDSTVMETKYLTQDDDGALHLILVAKAQ